MYQLIFPAFMTLIVFLFNLREKKKIPLYQYIGFFFLLASFNFLFSSSKAYAEYDLFKERYLTAINGQIIIQTKDEMTHKPKKSLREINKQFMWDCREKMDYHFDEGCKCFKEAQEACLWIPDLTERDKAQFCFNNFLAVLAPGTAKIKAIAALLSAFAQYTNGVMIEWQKIDTKLQQTKYHWEMEEFYRLAGQRMQDELYFGKK
jgi:hypothetical protein